MAGRRPYRLSPADRPIHEHLHTLFNEHRLICWSVAGHNAWWIEVAEGRWEVKTFDEVRSFLRELDPERCNWSTSPPKATPRASLLDLLARLSKVVVEVAPELAEEAQRALEAA